MKFTMKHEAKENTSQYEEIISYTIFHLTENNMSKAVETGIAAEHEWRYPLLDMPTSIPTL